MMSGMERWKSKRVVDPFIDAYSYRRSEAMCHHAHKICKDGQMMPDR